MVDADVDVIEVATPSEVVTMTVTICRVEVLTRAEVTVVFEVLLVLLVSEVLVVPGVVVVVGSSEVVSEVDVVLEVTVVGVLLDVVVEMTVTTVEEVTVVLDGAAAPVVDEPAAVEPVPAACRLLKTPFMMRFSAADAFTIAATARMESVPRVEKCIVAAEARKDGQGIAKGFLSATWKDARRSRSGGSGGSG
jgi:hypothetical protein